MSGRSKLRWAFVFVALILTNGLFWYFFIRMPELPPYRGEGTFRNTSWRFPGKSFGMLVPGFDLKFPEFKLSRQVDCEYYLGQLPVMSRPVVAYFCIRDPFGDNRDTDKRRHEFKVRTQIEVEDQTGRIVSRVDAYLAQMIWSFPAGGRDCYGLYILGSSDFQPQEGVEYRIRLRYSGSPAFADLRGFLYLRCGGSI